jgi:hypothetical protein
VNAILGVLAAKLFELLKSWIEEQWKQHGPELIEKAKDFAGGLFKEWMPKVIEATVVAQLAAAETIAAGSVDKITNAIPGTLDDQLLDPIVPQVFNSPLVKDFLGRLGIRR